MFQWQETYSVGLSDIDPQHRRLFQLADESHLAIVAGKGKDILDRVLRSLIAYPQMHFAAEEKPMRQYFYPEYGA